MTENADAYSDHLHMALLESTLYSVEVVGVEVEFAVGLDDIIVGAGDPLLEGLVVLLVEVGR